MYLIKKLKFKSTTFIKLKASTENMSAKGNHQNQVCSLRIVLSVKQREAQYAQQSEDKGTITMRAVLCRPLSHMWHHQIPTVTQGGRDRPPV